MFSGHQRGFGRCEKPKGTVRSGVRESKKARVFFRETVIEKRPKGNPGGTARKAPLCGLFLF